MSARHTAVSDKALEMRVYRLPQQIARARARVAQLEAEARRYGFNDLVQS